MDKFKKLKCVFGYKRLLLVLLVPLALLLVLFAKNCEAIAEWYALNIYKYISLFWNFISSLAPFSVAEVIVILLIPFVVFYIVFTIFRAVKKPEHRGNYIYKKCLNAVCAVSVVFALFITNFGLCYYRSTFASASGIEVHDSTVDELYGLCVKLAEKATEEREYLEEQDSVMVLSGGIAEANTHAKNAMNALEEKYPTVTSGYSDTKPVMLSHLWSYTDVTGMFFPFTFEANINIDIPHIRIPFTMCHELAHLRGYAREDEANFISYLACVNSESHEFRYSAYLMAFIYVSNELFYEDSEKQAEATSHLSEKVINDLNNDSEYWSQFDEPVVIETPVGDFEVPVSDIASDINDSYLKANDQEDGTKSYGRMVDLLIAYEERA